MAKSTEKSVIGERMGDEMRSCKGGRESGVCRV